MATPNTNAHGKQYGLITKKPKSVLVQKLSIFQDDSSDEESASSHIITSLKKVGIKNQIKKQTQIEIQKALEEDPTVYEYDSIYDEMERKKKEESLLLKGKSDKKPKYIESLLQAASVRKKEQDRRMERKIQKERAEEGDEFADKEEFVTSAYRKKLEEQAEEEEKERRQAELEAALDVTKQKDLSGFYRHLLNRTVGEEKTVEDQKIEDNKNMESIERKTKTCPEDVDNNKEEDNQSNKDGQRNRDGQRLDKHRSRDKDRKKHHQEKDHKSKECDLQKTAEESKKKRALETEECEQGKRETAKQEPEEQTVKFAKRNIDKTVTSAKERYLARKASRMSVVETEQD